MKPAHLIPPAAALLGSGILLAMQNQESVALREEITHMRGALHKAALLPSPLLKAPEKAGDAAATAGEDPAGPEGGKITGKDLALLAERGSSAGVPDIRAMLRLRSAIAAMSPEEVVALLKEVETGEYSERQKGAIKMALLNSISQKDPRAAVMIATELDTGTPGPADQSRWVLRSSFEMWAVQDPAAATAWYDARVAAGEYENKALSTEVNEKRVDFEQGLFRALFEKDPAAARSRLEALTPQERKMVMGSGSEIPTDPGAQKSFVAFTRELINEEDRAALIGAYGGRIAIKGELEDVSSFLDGIEALPEERREAVENAISGKIFTEGKKISEENSAEWRAWLTKNAPPGKVAETLGNSLGQLENMSLITTAKFAELASKISPEGGRDRMVASFLDKAYWRGDQEAALKLTRTIEDKDLRAAAIERLKQQGVNVESEPAPAK